MKIGLVGYGHFGKILESSLKAIGKPPFVVADPLHADDIIPLIEPFLDALDVVVIATPPDTHIDLAIKAINANAHVFCEKPISIPTDKATALAQAELIAGLAASRDVIVQVDHPLVYCPKRFEAVRTARHVEAVRENAGVNKHGISVVWDLLIHEVALAVATMGKRPARITVTPTDPTRDRVEVKMEFGPRVYVAKCENGSSRKRELYVDGNPIETTAEPLVEDTHPVELSLAEFFRAIDGEGETRTGIDHAATVARVLELIEAEIRKGVDADPIEMSDE